MSDETTIDQDVTPAQEAEPTAEQLDGEQVDQPTEEATTSEDSGDDSAADKPKPKGVQKRIDELTSNWRNTERDRDYWRDLALQSMKPQEPSEPEPQPQPQTSEKPNPDNFDSYEDYLEKLTDWKVEQREAERERKVREQQEREQQERQTQTWQERVSEARGKHEDFEAVALNPHLPVSEAMTTVLLESEQGTEVLYHLGKNPGEAERIAQLPAHLAALEIGRIEARLSIPAPKKHTEAPDPIEPVGGRKGSVTVDPERMSTDQWMEWRQKQLTNR